jgi:hypothetical protein
MATNILQTSATAIIPAWPGWTETDLANNLVKVATSTQPQPLFFTVVKIAASAVGQHSHHPNTPFSCITGSQA